MPYRYLPLIAITVLTFSTIMVASGQEIACSACTNETVGVSETDILNYPEPDVTPLIVDPDLLNDRWYQRIEGAVDIFDAPGGNVVGSLAAGFDFVTALIAQDGWTQINSGQWVQSEKLTNSNNIISRFSGVQLSDVALPYPMAWVLINMYPSGEPGGEPSGENPLVPRYTRVNLYASKEVEGFQWYQIGVGEWVHQHHVARVLPVDRPDGIDTERWISIDLFEQVVIAYEDTTPIFATLMASGMATWPTREGIYHIFFRTQRKNMSGGKPGDDFYYLEEVPWTMFFDEGRALHGAYWHDGFGFRRSHGCVNLSITDAHWLYNWVADAMGSRASSDKEDGPAVYVYSSGQYG